MRKFILMSLLICVLTTVSTAQPAAPPAKADEPVRIALDVTKDTKILVDGKVITFEKFAVLIEFAANAFDVDEAIYKDRKFASLKLVSRGK